MPDTKVKDRARSSALLGPIAAMSRLAPPRLRQRLQRISDVVVDVEVQVEDAFSHDGEPNAKGGGRPPYAFISYLAFVIVPFLATSLYYAFIASDQYIAEARFAVRSIADEAVKDDVDSSVMSTRPVSQDAYIVTSFIHSTEILERLSKKIDYRSVFSGSTTDFLSRFSREGTKEQLLKYWDNQVNTSIDGPSGIVTLRTRAFTPADATRLAELIISESETLINELSERAQKDVEARFGKEVERTSELYRAALLALNKFQNSSRLLSPESQATETGKLLAGLLQRKLEVDSRLFVLKQTNVEDSPAYQQLKLNKQSVEAQIEKLHAEMTGADNANANLAKSFVRFSQLETDRRVAESLYEIARQNLDTAQAQAVRQALYIVVFVQPSVPQDSLYPHRISTPLLVLLALTIGWTTIALIWASVEDHRL
ncbi:capsule biosynthesis protein [Ensifer sesbaniae]|uniref:capsule biosynthesis protein n=1 Tax=Ensifer sesbaniae TaxID=1214071 RepID=UPI001569C5BF|nr:capsule biosynthesis protein [Ensifer sesbaniae]NRQ18224.1 hypothetical protein [Ensifer sesbaniae]